MDTYGAKDALTLLLTVEGLLFAALSIGVATARRELGQVRSRVPFVISLTAVGVITLVAVGACSAWSHIYETHPGAAEATNLEVEGIALIAAIVAQPVLALAFVLWIFLRSR
jgi:uncharacterized integral membrane protein